MKNIAIARTVSQIIFFLLLVIFLVGAFCSVSLGTGFYLTCSLGALQLVIGSQQLIWGTIISGLALLIVTVMFGRFFCGWVCPFGALLDWLDKPLATLRAASGRLPAWLTASDNRNIKYGVLGSALLSAGILKYPAFCTVCPVGTICRTAGLQGINMGAETAVLPIIASLETVNKRFWCKTLCPIGALLGVVSRFSPFKVQLAWDGCAGCNRCQKACAMDNSPRYESFEKLKTDPIVLKALMESGIPDALDRPAAPEALPLTLRDIVTSRNRRLTVNPMECTRCLACVSACPVLNGRKMSHHTAQQGRPTAV